MNRKIFLMLLLCVSAFVGAEEGAREILYWYDPMRPDQHFDKPGKSPFMDMQLVPKYKDENIDNIKNHVPLLRQTHSVKTGVVQVDQYGQLTLPASAVLNTGKRHFVLRIEENGFFSVHSVKIKDEYSDPLVIISGINKNDRIVITPAFLIDADANVDLMWARFKQGDHHDFMDH